MTILIVNSRPDLITDMVVDSFIFQNNQITLFSVFLFSISVFLLFCFTLRKKGWDYNQFYLYVKQVGNNLNS